MVALNPDYQKALKYADPDELACAIYSLINAEKRPTQLDENNLKFLLQFPASTWIDFISQAQCEGEYLLTPMDISQIEEKFRHACNYYIKNGDHRLIVKTMDDIIEAYLDAMDLAMIAQDRLVQQTYAPVIQAMKSTPP